MVSCTSRRFFTTEPQGNPQLKIVVKFPQGDALSHVVSMIIDRSLSFSLSSMHSSDSRGMATPVFLIPIVFISHVVHMPETVNIVSLFPPKHPQMKKVLPTALLYSAWVH